MLNKYSFSLKGVVKFIALKAFAEMDKYIYEEIQEIIKEGIRLFCAKEF
jgi:hypothetical protein